MEGDTAQDRQREYTGRPNEQTESDSGKERKISVGDGTEHLWLCLLFQLLHLPDLLCPLLAKASAGPFSGSQKLRWETLPLTRIC